MFCAKKVTKLPDLTVVAGYSTHFLFCHQQKVFPQYYDIGLDRDVKLKRNLVRQWQF
jgi:hypothetical protein